jgi:hypothetical protein
MNMMNPASLANLKGCKPAKPTTKLKAWRLAQLVEDPEHPGVKRAMRITDAPRLYGIGATTWHNWEQPVGHPQFKRPTAENMTRLCGEITNGAVAAADFYPPVALASDSGG